MGLGLLATVAVCAAGVFAPPWLGGGRQAAWAGAAPAESTDWELIGNGHDGNYRSGLAQINARTVKDLGVAWIADMPTPDGAIRTSSTV